MTINEKQELVKPIVGIMNFEMPVCCAGCKFADLMRVADGEPYWGEN